MRAISAQEWQLTSFFEMAPVYSDPEDRWPYAEVVYRVERSGLSLSCAIHPAHRDVRIILERGGEILYELNAVGVHDIVHAKDGSGGSLKIMLNGDETLVMRIFPRIHLDHRAGSAS